jgi:hypothetical protein
MGALGNTQNFKGFALALVGVTHKILKVLHWRE